MNRSLITLLRVVLTSLVILILVAGTQHLSVLTWVDLQNSMPIWWKTLVIGTLLGGILGMAGFWLLARDGVFTGLALSASAGFGVLISAVIMDHIFTSHVHQEWAVYLTAVGLAFMLHAGLRAMFLRLHSLAALTAVVYITATAGLILVADLIPQGHHETGNLLFGNAVGVLDQDWLFGLPLAGLLLAAGAWLRKPGVALSFDEIGFRLTHRRPGAWGASLQIFILLTLILAAKILGVLATFSISLFAPLTAWRQARSARATFLLSVFYGLLLFPCGFAASFFLDLSTGASIAAAGFFMLSISTLMSLVTR